MSTYLLDTNVLVRLMEPAAIEHTMIRTAIHRLIDAGHTLTLVPQVLT